MANKAVRELTAGTAAGRSWVSRWSSPTPGVESVKFTLEQQTGRVWFANMMGITPVALTKAEYDGAGTGATDLATAINDLIVGIHSAYGGGTIYFGPGIYYHSGIVNYPRVRIMGCGVSTVFKLLPNTNQHSFRNRNANLASGGGEDGKCRDTFYYLGECTVHGNMYNQADSMWKDGVNWDMSTADYSGSTDNFIYSPDPRHTIDRVYFHQNKRDSVNIGGRGGCYLHRVLAGQSFRHGFHIRSYDNMISGCECGGVGADGMRIISGTNNITGCKLYFCGQYTQYRYGPTSGNSIGDYVPDTGGGLVSATDWQYGAGLSILADYLTAVNFFGEVQDTWGHGLVVDSNGNLINICCSNVGSLFARDGKGRGNFGSPNVLSDISAVYLADGAKNNIIDFNVVNQDGFPTSAGLLNHAVKAIAGSTKNLVRGVVQQGNLITSASVDGGTSNSITVLY